MWNRIKENAAAAAAVATLFVGFAAIVQFGVLNPIHQRFDAQEQRFDDLRADMNQRFEDLRADMNQRFDAVGRRFNDLRADVNQRFTAVDRRFNDLRAEMNQRFDAVDRRLEDLAKAVSDLRKLSDRVSRNEGRIDAITQQLQTADAPAP